MTRVLGGDRNGKQVAGCAHLLTVDRVMRSAGTGKR